jgi:hypothetical protein
MKEVLEATKHYLETTPLEEVVRTWMKYHTPENNVGLTMEEFLDANINSNEISPLEVLENMRNLYKIDFKHITKDIDGIVVWVEKPVLDNFYGCYISKGLYKEIDQNEFNTPINWNGKDIYSLE